MSRARIEQGLFEQGLFEQGWLRAGFGQSKGAWFEQVIGVVEQGMALSGARFGQGLGRMGVAKQEVVFEQDEFEKGGGRAGLSGLTMLGTIIPPTNAHLIP